MGSLPGVGENPAVVLPCAQPANANGAPACYDDMGWHLLSQMNQFAVIALDGGNESGTATSRHATFCAGEHTGSLVDVIQKQVEAAHADALPSSALGKAATRG